MKIKVTVEGEAPAGTTHYGGDVLDDPTWWKTIQRIDGEYWCYWHAERKGWYIQGTAKPHWIHDISEVK